MKKIGLLTLITALVVLLSSCGFETSKEFSEEPAKRTVINQTHNNSFNDLMAYCNGSLYVIADINTNYRGTYAVNENGMECVDKGNNKTILGLSLFLRDNKLYLNKTTWEGEEGETVQIADASDHNSNATASPDEAGDGEYFSEELRVMLKEKEKSEKIDLQIEYKNTKPYLISQKLPDADFSVSSVCVDGSTVYFLTESETLYSYNAETGEKPKRLGYIYDADDLLSGDGNIYYYCTGGGLSRYNLSNGSSEKLLSESCTLSYASDGKAYFCAESGIYTSDKDGKLVKAYDINVDGVYNYGEKYIYFHAKSGDVYQLNREDNKIRAIPVVLYSIFGRNEDRK